MVLVDLLLVDLLLVVVVVVLVSHICKSGLSHKSNGVVRVVGMGMVSSLSVVVLVVLVVLEFRNLWWFYMLGNIVFFQVPQDRKVQIEWSCCTWFPKQFSLHTIHLIMRLIRFRQTKSNQNNNHLCILTKSSPSSYDIYSTIDHCKLRSEPVFVWFKKIDR